MITNHKSLPQKDKLYIINDQNTGNNAYGNGEDSTTIKFETKASKPNL